MKKMPSHYQYKTRDRQNTNQTAESSKNNSENISLTLAQLVDNYDYNQRPGYGGKWMNHAGSFVPVSVICVQLIYPH